MHSHIDKAYDYLETHLPERYTSEVIELLAKKKVTVTSGVVRNVRTKVNTRIDVLNALLQVAKNNKKQFEVLQESFK